MKRVLLFLSVCCLTNCKTTDVLPTGVVANNAMVVTAREEASKVGL